MTAATSNSSGRMDIVLVGGARILAKSWTTDKDEVIDWLRFYNSRRLHSTLDYLSPMAFEKKWLGEKRKFVA